MWTLLLFGAASLMALTNAQGAPDEPFTGPVGQYHIQTDQGPERFFRFQTLSGQYRREQRHLDGSVTGTYGWVDPNGVLRLFDYVSDNQGYRIEQQRLFKVGKPIDEFTYLPTRGGEDLAFGFEVHPLGDGVDVVEVNPRRSPSPQIPLVTSPVRVGALTTTFGSPANPVSKQSQASFFTGLPVVPVVPPPPRVIVVEEPPAPEPVVIGHTSNSLPDPPAAPRRFVIGAAANGDEITRPVTRNRPTVGAAAGGRTSRPASPARSQTVIGAARSRSSSPSRPSTPSRQRATTPTNNNRGSGIVIGLRHNNRKRRSPFFF